MSRRMLVLGAFLTLVQLTGCSMNRCGNVVAARHGCSSCGSPPVGRLQPVPVAPPGGAVAAPPGAVMPAPPPASFGGESTPAPPPGDVVPTPPSAVAPPAGPVPGGPPANIQLGPPGPAATERRSLSPSTAEPPPAALPGAASSETPDTVDLPGFAVVAPGIATGIRPFPGGIDWLKRRNYRSVLHLYAPGEDLAAARRQFSGLRFLSLEVSANRLTRDIFEDFLRIVEEPDNQPIFVSDKTGAVAGGLWYLYFRVHKKQDEETARAESRRLGLNIDDDPDHKAMWLAVQKLRESMTEK